jgi:hypothetical protein
MKKEKEKIYKTLVLIKEEREGAARRVLLL